MKWALVFDLDSTLIPVETIDELARLHGVYEQVAQVTERAMCGELDFTKSLRQRVSLLRGLNAEYAWDTLIGNIKLVKGAKQLSNSIASSPDEFRLVIVSGGFVPVARHVAGLLRADAYYANVLEVASLGQFTGKLGNDDSIVDGKFKADIVEKYRLRGFQVAAIGDGSNDLAMFKAADVSIAVSNAKPSVKAAAQFTLADEDLMPIFDVLSKFGLE
jgi:phosphoserine phosphatase